MCKTCECETKNTYEQCDFCSDLLPSNHFYPVDISKAGRNVPLDMVREPKPKMCNWCFSSMVGVLYNPIKSNHKYNE